MSDGPTKENRMDLYTQGLRLILKGGEMTHAEISECAEGFAALPDPYYAKDFTALRTFADGFIAGRRGAKT